jgi:hypothetical protein
MQLCHRRPPGRARWAWLPKRAWPVLLCASAAPGFGQGTVVFHNTGGGQSLVSEVRSLSLTGTLSQPYLRFDFGFATDETPTAGAFLDSFSVSIQDASQSFSAIYATADATGIAWAPPTPGTLFIDPASILVSPISYPNLQPVLSRQNAFEVTAPIPSQFLVGGSINVYFDLFDNLDNRTSQGWFSGLTVSSVPEPQVWALLCVGFAWFWASRRRNS